MSQHACKCMLRHPWPVTFGEIQFYILKTTILIIGKKRQQYDVGRQVGSDMWLDKHNVCLLFNVYCSQLLLLLLLRPLFNQVSLLEIKISLTRETWPRRTAVHNSNIKHKTKYKFNTKWNSDNTLRSFTQTFAISNEVRRQTLYNSFRFTESN